MALPPGADRRAAVPPTRRRKPPVAKPPVKKPPVGKRPPASRKPVGGKGPRVVTTKRSGSKVGFNAEKMAKTLTDLGYDAEINQIQRAIEENARMEMQAMANITDWTGQIEDQRARGAGSIANVWNQAIAGNAASDQNIANLFGESAKGDALKAMDPGADMLQAMSGSNQAFMQYMAPILQAQGMDYKARARGEFGDERRELTGQMRDTRREKTQAYGKNLMDMMQLGWTREGQLFDQRMANLQARQAQQALDQSERMFGPELQAQKLANKATAQSIRLNEVSAVEDQKLSELQRQQARQAMRRADVEIRQLEQQGVDLLDPQASMQVAQAAMAGGLNKNGVIMMNPRLALRTAMDVLAAMGLEDSPEAMQAVMKAFEVSLRFSHSRGAWKKWVIKDGKLVYNPTTKGGKGGRKGGTPYPGPH